MTETLRYVLEWPDKFPGEVFLNGVDWTDRLAGAGIANVTATRNVGDVTIDTPAASFAAGNVQYVWIGGGTTGRQVVTCRAVTNETPARTLEESFSFNVLESK